MRRLFKGGLCRLPTQAVHSHTGAGSGPLVTMTESQSTPEQGPCQTEQFKLSFPVSCAGGLLSLKTTVDLPAQAPQAGPASTIFFLNGFQLRSGFYEGYAHGLASWGYAVVRYNLPLFKVVVDAVELRFLAQLSDWLGEKSRGGEGPLAGRLDLSQVAVMGHSRGAKLAALYFAGNPGVRAAYLIDPVDNTSATPEGKDYPSAVRALAQSGRSVGIVGAGVVSKCNPAGSNFKEFYGAGAPGTWLTRVLGSGHADFADAGAAVNCLLGLFCKGGGNSHQETLRLTLPGMLAYLSEKMPSPHNSGGLDQFLAFVRREVAARNLTYEVKGEEGKEGAEPPASQQQKAQQLDSRTAG